MVVEEMGVLPDEGTCISVLRTAARHGAPDLATEVLGVLKGLDIQWDESHFSAVVEAFCQKGQIKEALLTLGIMKENQIIPTAVTTSCITERALTSSEAIDDMWGIVDQMHQNGQPVDDALKLIVESSAKLGDLQRTVGAYKALSDYNMVPDIEMCNAILDACVAVQHRQLADMVLEDMKKAGVVPNEETYSKLIHLCLSQPTYEQAFFYLEEMKGAGILPPRDIYVALISKCWSVGDNRAELVVEELRECGYAPIRKPVAVDSKHGAKESSVATQAKVDKVAQDYINNGGVRT